VTRTPKRSARGPADDRSLADLDGIGPAMLADLGKLEVPDVAALARQDPELLYRRLCLMTGVRQDPCVLDTFCCAVAQARDPDLPAAQRKWWWWSRRRKAAASRRA
jgi:hypothetical protein